MTRNNLKKEILLKCCDFENHEIKHYKDLDKECLFMNTICKIVLKYSNLFSVSFFSDVVGIERDIKSNLYCGYYCPSPTCDILIGGLKRGKISTRGKIYTHEHGFDNDNKLIFTKTFSTNETDESMTYYMYFKNLILQFTFDIKNELTEMAISRYESNNIVSYCKACVYTFNKIMIDRFDFAECYKYKNNHFYRQKSYNYRFSRHRKYDTSEFDIDEKDERFSKEFNRYFDENYIVDCRNMDSAKFFDIIFFMYDENGYVTDYKYFEIKNNELYSVENFKVLKSLIRKQDKFTSFKKRYRK